LVKVNWTEGAIKDLEKLDKPIARRILARIAWFSKNFERIIPEPLTGGFKGAFKLRVGNWRVVYTVEGETIVIQFVWHRREIYKIK
jgi:mRNA interferase RelE/StbE